MYLILKPKHEAVNSAVYIAVSGSNCDNGYHASFTDDIDDVSKAFKTKGTKIYRLDNLQEILNVEVSYKEITTETQNDGTN